MSGPAAGADQKVAWPLYVVAALSFVPFLGVFFAAAGATWGLVSSRRYAVRAAIVALAGGLCNIAGMLLLGIYGSHSNPALAKADQEMARRDLLKVVVALDRYHEAKQAYPPSLPDLKQSLGVLHPLNTLDNSAGAFHFQNFHYVVAADGQSYDLFGVGPDNKPGTSDDVRPVIPDSLKAHTGFRPAPARATP
jgi:hypothetical protein